MLPTFGETVNDPGDLWAKIKALFGGGLQAPSDPSQTPVLPAMNAQAPDPELLGRYGWSKDLPPEIQRVMESPFMQDTVQKILGEVPQVGMAKDMPEDARGAWAFVDPELRHRVYMNPMVKGGSGVPGVLFHEAVHTQQDMVNPEVWELMEALSPDYERLIDSVIATKDDPEMLAVYATRSPNEHAAYVMESAMSWIRGSQDPEELEILERIMPGTKRAKDFILKQLER